MKKSKKKSKTLGPSRATPRSKPARAESVAPDPRVAKLLTALRSDGRLAPSVAELERAQKSGAPKKFGSNGLKTGGKLFALFTQGTLVVKLPKQRVSELSEEKQGEPFDPGRGRLMKEWLTVTSPKASWSALAREAFEFVSGSKR